MNDCPILVVASNNSDLDLQRVMKFPIIRYIPCHLLTVMAHSHRLTKQHWWTSWSLCRHTTVPITQLPDNFTPIYDGGLVLRSILFQIHSRTSYSPIARMILSVLCSNKGTEVHICYDKFYPRQWEKAPCPILSDIHSDWTRPNNTSVAAQQKIAEKIRT